ncbi:MAG: carboxymuconolactone decarboxylase family protein [Planctomycetota bacterium]|jgi:alkylhydroperoxidase family enzyme|nr:carboxymuconolactone decarboxylase family protein [Planctomycetota bacterium]HBO53620.1 peroxidase [Planctomycetota bacterium]|tara:strand:- start:210 stop:455 length:246 start_codon:yes stop_codon:yes gene_type:complete
MAWIESISPEVAEGALKKEYDEAITRSGEVANVVSLSSLNPGALSAWVGVYKAVMYGPSPLERYERELVATVVSQENECRY